MVQFKVKTGWFRKEVYYLPTSYGELPMWKIQTIPETVTNASELFEVLLDCPHKIDPNLLAPFAQFLNEPIDLSFYEAADNIPDIRTDTYLKRLVCEDLIKLHKQPVAITKVLSLYFSTDLKPHKSNDDDFIDSVEREWLKLSLDECAPLYMSIVNQINMIVAMEDSIKPPPDPQQMEAGVSEFGKLGAVPTIDMLAHGKIWKHDAVLAKDYNSVFFKLKLESVKTKFGKELRRIMERDAKLNAKKK